MTELLWQATFLLLLAFFAGAVFACTIKRKFYYRSAQRSSDISSAVVAPSVAPDASQPRIEVTPRAAPEGQRFEKALSGVAPVSAPAPAQTVPAAKPAPVAPVQPAPAPVAAPVAPPAAAAAPAVAASPEAVAGIPNVSVSTGSGAPLKFGEGGAGPSDDLSRIRGVDPILQRQLKEMGLRRYEDIARLTPRDVKGLSEALGLDARVSLENWVGQAQVLAQGGETYYSRRLDRGVPVPETKEPTSMAVPAPVAASAAPQPPAAPPAPAAAAAAPSEPEAVAPAQGEFAHLRSVRSEALLGEEGARAAPLGDADDLKRIRGIGVLIEKKLNSLGILTYEQVANWTGADVDRISNILDFKGRIERENWIEQARILAAGGQTEFSRRGG